MSGDRSRVHGRAGASGDPDARAEQLVRDGFAVLPQALPTPVVALLAQQLDGALRRSYGQRSGAADHEQAVLTMGPETPQLADALEQPVFWDLARATLGDDALGIACYGTSHTGDTGWHADSPRDFPEGVKFSLYLDEVGEDSGSLRVVPGSHRGELHRRLRERVLAGVDDRAIEAVPCPSRPGDVVAFDLRLFHAALGGGGDRRVINLFYYRNPRTPEQERLVFEQIVEDYQWLSDKNRADGRVFHPHWLANDPGSAVRQRWIERFGELGFFPEGSDGLLAAIERALPPELEAPLRAAVEGAGWRWLASSVKTELVRVRVDDGRGEVLLLLRPADDPHPRYATRGGLAFGYSTLDCRPLDDARRAVVDAVVDAAPAGLRDAMGVR